MLRDNCHLSVQPSPRLLIVHISVFCFQMHCSSVPEMHPAAIVFSHQLSQYDVILVRKSYEAVSIQDVFPCEDISPCVEIQRKNDSIAGSPIANGRTQPAPSDRCPVEILTCRHAYSISLDGHQAGCIDTLLRHSKQFCKGFLSHVRWKGQKQKLGHCRSSCNREDVRTNGVCVKKWISVQLLPVKKEWIDYKW